MTFDLAACVVCWAACSRYHDTLIPGSNHWGRCYQTGFWGNTLSLSLWRWVVSEKQMCTGGKKITKCSQAHRKRDGPRHCLIKVKWIQYLRHRRNSSNCTREMNNLNFGTLDGRFHLHYFNKKPHQWTCLHKKKMARQALKETFKLEKSKNILFSFKNFNFFMCFLKVSGPTSECAITGSS